MNENIMMYAFRYALGRRTYAVEEMVSYIVKYWDFTSTETKIQIKKEIEEFKQNYGNLGDKCDEEQWNRILALRIS